MTTACWSNVLYYVAHFGKFALNGFYCNTQLFCNCGQRNGIICSYDFYNVITPTIFMDIFMDILVTSPSIILNVNLMKCVINS